MAKEIKFGADARAALEAGVDKLQILLKLHWDQKEETLF